MMTHSRRQRLKVVSGLVTTRPHVLIIPLCLGSLMLGLGVWGVIEGARRTAASERQKAQYHLESATSSLQLTLQDAITPAIQLADWIKHTRNYTLLMQQFKERVPDWWSRAPATSMALTMAPAGVITGSYPPFNEHLLAGTNVLAHPNLRNNVLESIRNGEVTIGVPVYFEGQYTMTVQIPIMIRNVSEDETWGIPMQPYNCPPEMCYNSSTRTRWWGNAGLTVNASFYVSEDGPLSKLIKAGYQVQVWRPPSVVAGEPDWQVVGYTGTKSQPSDPIEGDVVIANLVWKVCVWVDSWNPGWQGPLVAMVVVVAIICSLLIFAVLLSWEEHRVLLTSLLPQAAIDRIRAEMDWTSEVKNQNQLKLLELDTPAQHIKNIIRAVQEGHAPKWAEMVAVQAALLRGADVYRPTNQDLQARIKGAEYDGEVRRALVQQLVGTTDQSGEMEETPTLERKLTTKMKDVVIMVDNPAADRLTTGVLQEDANGVVQGSAEAPRSTVVGDFLVKQDVTGSLQTALLVLMDKYGAEKAPEKAPDGTGEADFTLALPPVPSESGAVTAPEPQPAAAASTPRQMPGPEKSLVLHLERVLNTANTWSFDVFALEEASCGRPLSVLGYWLMHITDCTSYAKMDRQVLARFLRLVEEGYPNNPYHNRRHAADVLQNMHMILHHGGLAPGYADQHTILCCYLAAIVHDFQHTGLTNDYLVNTHDELAVRYNDRSPMENHHLAATFTVLKAPEYNCLAGLNKSNWDKLRKLLIELVLATDMKQHFAIVGQFSTLHGTVASPKHNGTSIDGSAINHSEPEQPTHPAANNSSGAQPIQPVSDNDKLLSLQMALKCADLGNLAAPLPVYLRWVNALEEELFLQGDAERAKSMPLSPLCDRTKEGVSKSQIGFFDFVAMPLFSHFTQRFPASMPMLKAAIRNYQNWKPKKRPSQSQ